MHRYIVTPLFFIMILACSATGALADFVSMDNVYLDQVVAFNPQKAGAARTPYLGGDGFDLSTFLSLGDDSPWQDDMKMVYVRMIDDDTILDGQGYAPAWKTGAIMQAAMGINVMKIAPVPVPGTGLLLFSGIFLMVFRRTRQGRR